MNLMLVDDGYEYGRDFSALCRRHGFNVTQIKTALEAQIEFNKNPQNYDLIVIEGRPIGMSASALIEEIKDVNDDIPIVVLSDHMSILEQLTEGRRGADFGANKTLVDDDAVYELMHKFRDLIRIYK